MLIHTERIVFTTVLGEASGNTNMYLKGICHEIGNATKDEEFIVELIMRES